MIGYVCKYTPVEVFEAMGVEIRRIQPGSEPISTRQIH